MPLRPVPAIQRVSEKHRCPVFFRYALEHCPHFQKPILKEVLSYDLSELSDQRDQSGQHLRHHRPGLYHGLRYCQDVELRPRRCHHGGRVHLLLCGLTLQSATAGGRHPGHDRLHGSGHGGGAAGLQAPAAGALPGRADHRHRRQLFPPEHGVAVVVLQPQGVPQLLCLRLRRDRCGAVRRPVEDLLCDAVHHHHLRHHHAGSDLVHWQDQDGQGHAGLL